MEYEMEVEEVVFEAYEVDIEYEFDAAVFFDFTREETSSEARKAEVWFESARSYPPSPFVTKLLVMDDALNHTVNTSPKPKDVDYACDSDVGGHRNGLGQEFHLEYATNRLMTFYNHLSNYNSKVTTTCAPKSYVPRSSTLMKPTASQLAKQNQPRQPVGSRSQKLQVKSNEKSFCNTSGVESHAIKKQKLDGGHSRKVIEPTQQTNFVHKVAHKDGTVDNSASHARLRITIPREPDLETAHRAQRIRPKKTTELEHVTMAPRRFKARPLNKKILEAPSFPLLKKSTPKLPEFQEFHLRTLERAMHNTSTVPSSSEPTALDKPTTSHTADNESREPIRSHVMENFKAHPLSKKIFSSKWDIDYRNCKREATIPRDFKFHAEKRNQQPPTDLFSKLSLTSELQQHNGSRMKLPKHSFMPVKGSKENRSASIQPENKAAQFIKEKPPLISRMQAQWGNDGCITEVGTQFSKRSLGIR